MRKTVSLVLAFIMTAACVTGYGSGSVKQEPTQAKTQEQAEEVWEFRKW